MQSKRNESEQVWVVVIRHGDLPPVDKQNDRHDCKHYFAGDKDAKYKDRTESTQRKKQPTFGAVSQIDISKVICFRYWH